MQVVPGHVYDEIDRLVEAGNYTLAYEAVERAVSKYLDPAQAARFHCLWLFHKGAMVAEAAGRPQVALSYLNRFVVDGDRLVNEGPHVLEVLLSHAQIRPPRLDELADARNKLPELERRTYELLKENLPDKSEEELHVEVAACKSALTSQKKSGPCFIATAAYGHDSAYEVQLLRAFRDERLTRFALGRLSIAAYNSVSPMIARHIRPDGRSGWLVRRLLKPVTWTLGATNTDRRRATVR